jgi:uncharacterized protein (TIGR00251 family)
MESGLSTVRDDGSIELNVHAQPGAGRTQITGRHGPALKIRVAVPPEHGKANEALGAVLATAFGLPRAGVTLLSGDRSRAKRFLLSGIEVDAFDARLADLVAGASTPGRSARPRSERRPDTHKD